MSQQEQNMNHSRFQSHRPFLKQVVAISLISLLLSPMGIFALTPKAWSDELKQDIVLMVDNSGSMKKNDPEFLAHHALKAFISENDDAARVALIVFDQNVNLTVPFTSLTDEAKPALLGAIQKIDYSGSLTNSPAALERAIYELTLHGREQADKSIIFITDGVVDTGNQVQDKQKENWMREELSALASELNIRIFGIAFTEAANYQLLQTLALKTKGDYFRVLRADDLSRVFTRLREINRPMSVSLPETDHRLKEKLSMQTLGDSMRESLNVVKPGAGLLTQETTDLNDSLVAKAPLTDSESRVSSESNRSQIGLTNEAKSRDVDIRVLVISALLLSLMAFSALLWVRKGTPRGSRENAQFSPSAQDYQPKAFLIDINHHTSKREHSLSQRITMIGRVNTVPHSCGISHLLINKPTVGREHAVIEFKDDGYWLVDQGSVNGTFVNGKRVKGKVRLKDGNRVCFYDTEFIFTVPELNKHEKTLIVPVAKAQEETVLNRNIILNNYENQEQPPRTSTITKVKSNSAYSNMNSQERLPDKTYFITTQEDMKQLQAINNSNAGEAHDSEDPLDNSIKSMIRHEARENVSDDTERLMFDSQSVKEKTQSMESAKGNTRKLNVTQLSRITTREKQTRELRKTDTDEIAINTFELMFDPEQHVDKPIENAKNLNNTAHVNPEVNQTVTEIWGPPAKLDG
jgi:pSer/pThr/pTyr-binding forkhead associated (FHA) protein/Mg-chelatase subunit ChlD